MIYPGNAFVNQHLQKKTPVRFFVYDSWYESYYESFFHTERPRHLWENTEKNGKIKGKNSTGRRKSFLRGQRD